MTERNLLISFFAFAGFTGALVSTLFLYKFVGPEHSRVVLGFRQHWLWFTFPIVGAALSAFWARICYEGDFGILRGALVSLYAFVSFCALLSLIGMGPGALFAFVLFGFMLVGWPLVLLGGATGWLYRRLVLSRRANPRLD